MPKKIKNGQSLHVSLELEFEGVVSNYIVKVEDQQINTVNNKADNFPIKFNGDPILISGSFTGDSSSKIKKFEVTINGYTAKYNDIKLKTGEVEIKDPKPFIFFDLQEV